MFHHLSRCRQDSAESDCSEVFSITFTIDLSSGTILLDINEYTKKYNTLQLHMHTHLTRSSEPTESELRKQQPISTPGSTQASECLSCADLQACQSDSTPP